ncbi:hypothetical protein N2152v2_009006 [Parachlorella kessleri]
MAACLLPGATIWLPGKSAVESFLQVTGPQYVLGSESNPLDNLSVLKTPERLWGAVNKINNVAPAVNLVLVLGDFVHDAYWTLDYEELKHGPVNAYHVTSGIMERLNASYMVAYGNHDFEVVCKKKHSVRQKLTIKLYEHFFNASPYSCRDLPSGWKVLVLNSMLGRTWRAGDRECNTRLSSYGHRQLKWAADQLKEGKPTVVVMHHPLPTSLMDEEPDLKYPDIVTLLSSFDNVKLVLTGHYHKGVDWEDLYPFPALTLPALRYTDDNFFLLDLKSDGSYSMPDWDKNKGGSRCSQSYAYLPSGGAKLLEARPPTAGDCGIPLGEDTFRYQLPPIESREDIPLDFNPELSCSFTLSMQATNAAFAAEGLDLTRFIEDCAPYARGAPIFYRGDGACPAAPTKEEEGQAAVESAAADARLEIQKGVLSWLRGRELQY